MWMAATRHGSAFTDDPNLAGGSIGNGYRTFSIKARADGKDVREPMIASWGSEDLIWRSGDTAVIKGWANGESYEILVPLFGGSRSWRFDMTGARTAIAKACPDATN